MDDFNLSTLTEARNEYIAIFIAKLTPPVLQGIYSVFNDAVELCDKNDEHEKYLMTFQNFLARVSKWNQELVNQETERILKVSNCNYLEDLLTCVHVTQLKMLTSIRVGQKQKKIEISIPKLSEFIHKVYIVAARRLYKNVFLFEANTSPLQRQKNMRECELIVKESILNVIRDNMPIESIIRAYLDETTEDDVEETKEEVREEFVEEEIPVEQQREQEQREQELQREREQQQRKQEEDNSGNKNINNDEDTYQTTTSNIGIEGDRINVRRVVDFNDKDNVINYNKGQKPEELSSKQATMVEAPKTIDRLEQISRENFERRRAEEQNNDDNESTVSEDSRIKFLDNDSVVNSSVFSLDLEDLTERKVQNQIENLLNDDEIEVLT
jgi:hypothetical protein